MNIYVGEAPEDAPKYYEGSTAIIKPLTDRRSYEHIRLSNGIRAILIHDPQTDKSAASIGIKVGGALDPRNYSGVAHFLEHMLFQGTEKYPKESEYMEFMAKNGGYNNAFTSTQDTNFHF